MTNLKNDKVTGTVVAYKKGGYAWLDYLGEHVFLHIQDVKGIVRQPRFWTSQSISVE